MTSYIKKSVQAILRCVFEGILAYLVWVREPVRLLRISELIIFFDFQQKLAIRGKNI